MMWFKKRYIRSVLTRLDGKSVPYREVGPMIRGLYEGEYGGMCCPLYGIKDYEHITTMENDVTNFGRPKEKTSTEPYIVIMKKDNLDAIMNVLFENDKQKIRDFYKEVKNINTYIYIRRNLAKNVPGLLNMALQVISIFITLL